MAEIEDIKYRVTATDGATPVFRQIAGALQTVESGVMSLRAGMAGLVAGAVTSAFIGIVKGAIDAADHLNDLSKSTGVAVEQLSGLQLAAKQSGGDLDSIAGSLNKLSQNMGKEADKFKALGITAKDPLEAFKQLSDIFNTIRDPQLRAAVAAEALGKAWAGAAPLLAEGSAKIQDMVETGSRLSGVTKETAEQADKFNDELVKLEFSAKGAGMAIANVVLPPLNRMLELIQNPSQKVSAPWWDDMFSRSAVKVNEWVIALERGSAKLAGLVGASRLQASHEAEAAALEAANQRLRGAPRDSAMASFRAGERASYGAAGDDDAARRKAEAAAKRFVGPPDHSAEQELKSYTSALKTYFEALGRLNNMTQSEKAHFELFGQNVTDADGHVIHLYGSLEKLTDSHKRSIQALADEATARENNIKIYETMERAVAEESAAIEAQEAIRRAAHQANQDYLEDLGFQAELVGKSALQQQRLNEMHRIDINLRNQLRAIAAAAGDNNDLYERNAADARRAADQQKDDVNASVDARLEAERRWETGAATAFQDYIDHATNAADRSRDALSAGFRTLEDLEMDFVFNSGKNWRQLALSFIQQIARMELAAANAKLFQNVNAAGGVGGFFGNLFGGGGPKGTAGADMAAGVGGTVIDSYADGTDYVPRTGLYQLHQGEKVTPAAQNTGGGVTVHLNFALGVQPTVRAEVQSMLPMIVSAARAGVAEAAQRSPSYAAALKGR